MKTTKSYEEFAQLSDEEKKGYYETLVREHDMYHRWWFEGEKNLNEVIGQRDAEIERVSMLKKGISVKLQEILDEHNAIVEVKNSWLKDFVRCYTIEELNAVKSDMLRYELENNDNGSFSDDLKGEILAIIESTKDHGNEEGTDESAD